MAVVKPLHVATSLEELNKKVDTKLIEGATPKILCRMAEKLMLKARDESLSGDEEQAYILYMRFVDVVKAVRASKEYKRDKRDLDKALPSSKISGVLDKAEQLSSSLKKRYAELKTEEDQVVPEQSTEQEPVTAEISMVTPSTPPHLTPTQLYTLFTSTPSQVIVLDCRTRGSFVASHPDGKKYPQWLSIPQETVVKGLTDQSVTAFLKPKAKELWRQRASMSHVVMVDDCSTNEKIETPILALWESLTKWESDSPLSPPNPYLLDGGYHLWYLSYPVTCLGRYKPVQRSEVKVQKPQESTDALAYPTFEDTVEPVTSDLSTSDPSSVSIDMDDTVAMETTNNQPVDAYQPTVSVETMAPNTFRAVPMDMYMMPTFAPLPPAPMVPLSLEGESELLAPSLTDDLLVEPLESQSEEGFGIVAEQAVINTPLPGGHAPMLYHQEHYQPHPVNQHLSQPVLGNQQPPLQGPMSQQQHLQHGNQPLQHGNQQQHLQHGNQPLQHGNQQPMLPPVNQPLQHGNQHPPLQGQQPPLQQPSLQPLTQGYPPQTVSQGPTQPVVPHHDPQSVSHPGPVVHPPLNLNRVIEGPLPNPPSYEQSHHLPSLAPVQPPIPPPVSVNQSGHLVQSSQQLSEKDTRIRELEQRLANSERAAHERSMAREQENKLKEQELVTLRDQVAQERAKLQQDSQRQEQEMMLARQQLAQEREMARAAVEAQKRAIEEDRQRVHMESKQIMVMKEQFDRERAEVTARQNQMRQQFEQRRREEQQRVFSLQSGLPPNWEKRLDRTTGRFYYVDHDTKTTHWNPPTNWINYQRARQEEVDRRKQPTPAAPSSIPTASSTQQPVPGQQPSQQQPVPGQQPSQKSTLPPPVALPNRPAQDNTPVKDIERSTKPEQPNIPDRSKKPVAKQPVIVMTPAKQQQKKHNLQAVFGTGRYVLTGLRNLGNSCYMNSTLQCLASTTPVIKYFISGAYLEHINHSNPLGTRGEVAIEFSWLMKAMWCGQYKSVSPRDFKDMIGRFVVQMRGTDQQDTQEFLAFLLDGLHEDLNKVKKKVYIAEPDDSKDDVRAAELAWENHLRRNDSVIVKFFQGMFRSSIKCLGCGKSSVTFEPFMYLSLPIPPGQGVYSLEDCVKLFVKAETVEWSCPNCNDPRGRAVKKMDIWRLPPVLLIHLKRFSYQGLWKEKRQNTINYPSESNLDMMRYVAGPKGYKSFSLYAVSNHFGTLTGGHYTACCRNPYNKMFYNFDDHDVKEALPRQVKSSAAYILYYTAVDLSPGQFTFS